MDKIYTTQQTSQRLKMHMVGGVLTLLAGIGLMFTNAGQIGAWIALGGTVWWLWARFSAWWNHG